MLTRAKYNQLITQVGISADGGLKLARRGDMHLLKRFTTLACDPTLSYKGTS